MSSSSSSSSSSWEKKALLELRIKLEDAIRSNKLLKTPAVHKAVARTRVASSHIESCNKSFNSGEEVELWGVPLLPSKGHEGTDAVLLKFLRAREFKVNEAMEMLQRTLMWRMEFGMEGIMEEEETELPELEKVAFIDGVDREGHPVCYNVYGELKDEEWKKRMEEKRERVIRWRVRSMEKGVRLLSFKPGGAMAMLQVTDLKDSLTTSVKEIRSTSMKAVSVMQDNYPELVHKNIFVNVSFRYYVYNALLAPFITQRSKSKFIFARPQKVTETLLKFISPERLPIQYGGLKRNDDHEFTTEDEVSEMSIRGGEKETIEILIHEPGVTVVWDITVVGWEVNYKEEFIPDDEGSYRVLIRKERRMEESMRNSFYISEPGKVVLTIKNRTFKKKKILYRTKSRPTIYLYNLLSKKHHPQYHV